MRAWRAWRLFFIATFILITLSTCESQKPPHFASSSKVGRSYCDVGGFRGACEADGPSGGVPKN
jgi:hypothetical protein